MDSSEVFKPVLAGVVRHGLTALGGAMVTGGVMQSSDVSGFVGAGMLLAGVGWSWYQKVGQAQIAALLKKVTAKATVADAAAVAKSTSTVVKVMIAAFLLSAFLAPAAFAADNLPAFPVKIPLASTAPCVPQSCSGWYAGFGILGDGSNADIIGNGINGSVFSTGGVIKVQGGYQLWNGAFFAAIDGSAGYEFTTNASANAPIVQKGGSKFIGTELVKLGYNFFPQAAVATTAPSQSPIPLTVPANLLASSTPYFTFGGMQRRGISEWVNGVGVQTVIAAGWSTDVRYLYAPSQQGVPATSIVMFELNKHF